MVTSILDLITLVASLARVPFFDFPFGVGLTFVALRCVRGEETSVGELFYGFRRYWTVVGLGVLVTLSVFAAMIPGFIIVGVGVVVAQGNMSDLGIAIAIIGGLISAVGAICIGVRLLYVTLIAIDPRMRTPEFVDCFKLSWKLTGEHFYGLIGLIAVLGLIAAVSGLLLVLPYFFFGLPLLMAGVASAYHLITRPVATPQKDICSVCGYAIVGIVGVCPECGEPIPNAEPTT
ncbi:MAG: hypothetical protein CMJ31_08445 [Phycisphaerae bacterium]|nr:hypothetical protein [Phycisphaerae bacterium]